MKLNEFMNLNELIATSTNISITIAASDLQEFARTLIDLSRKELAVKNEEEYMTTPEVCELLGVSKTTLWTWDKKVNLLHPRRIGRKTLYMKSEVLAFVKN